jgi:outer membrane immunogenic protein
MGKKSVAARIAAGVLAGIAFGALAPSARAADVPLAVPYAPVLRPVYDWTACYLGFNIGGGAARKSMTDVNGIYGPLGGPLGSHGARGVAGGGQVGCDYQAGPLVFGVQGLLDASGLKGSNFQPGGVFVDNSYLQWFATATGRLGVVAAPTLLLYAKAGGAWAHDVYNVAPFVGPTIGLFNALGSATPRGWTAGAGLEWAFFGGAWTAFAEYDYIDLRTARTTFTSVVTPGLTFPFDIRQSVNLFLFGINYRFGAGGRGY